MKDWLFVMSYFYFMFVCILVIFLIMNSTLAHSTGFERAL